MPKYLALLRGINVGGNNLIKMADLKACFEKMKFTDVTTYIQSGNVVFTTKATLTGTLETRIEQALSKQFSYSARVVVISHKELREFVENAPKEFGAKPEVFRYNAIFLKKPYTPKKAMTFIRTREDVDTATAGKRALYFSNLIARATQSYLSKIIQTPLYPYITIRNWNTTTKLLALMDTAK